ncbi:MAG: CHASE2 domain-containing protein, partial [Pseudomonadota bacterium]
MNISPRPLLRKIRENFWLSGIFLTIVTSAFTLVIFNNLSIAKLAENHLSDVRIAMLSRPLPQSTHIAIILITDKTLENYPYRSPLDRSLITEILEKLDSSSVAGIGINVLFDRPTEPVKDDALYQKLQQLSVPVVASQVSSSSGFSASQIQYSNQFLKNIRTGLSTIYRDPVDHTIRAAILRKVQGRTVHLGFSAKLADVFGLALPPDEKINIDYRSGPDYATTAFPVYLAHELDAVPSSWLQNRIVLIGTDLGSSSRLRTPLSILSSGFDRDLPGVVVEAHILSQIIEGRTLNFAGINEKLLYVVLMAALGCLISSLTIRFFFKLVIILMVVPASWMVAFSIYYFGNHIVPMVAPTVAFLAAIVFSIFWQWRAEQQKRERIHHSFGQYLAPSVVEKILSNSEDLDL